MGDKTNKYSYKSIKSDKVIGDAFEIHSKKLGLGMKESIDIVMKFIVENNISPDDLDFIWQKRARTELNNAKSELMQIHNLSVGFLRTFEKNQESFWKDFKNYQLKFHENLINNLTVLMKKYQIQDAVFKEILYNTQIFLKQQDDDFGTKISSKNWENIIEAEKKILNDNKA